MKEDLTRNTNICNKLKSGKTLEEVGKEYGISKERTRQIFRKYNKDAPTTSFGIGKIMSDRAAKRKEEIKRLYNRDTLHDITDLERVQGIIFSRKKQNSKTRKHEFSITMSDLDWPRYCP